MNGSAPVRQNYLDHLEAIASEDVAGLLKAEQSYGDSWKKRGGVGAYMMLARKWDRLALRVEHPLKRHVNIQGEDVAAYDIFDHIAADTRTEGVIDDIRDLRRYLMLVEAEMRAQGATCAISVHRDNTEPSAES